MCLLRIVGVNDSAQSSRVGDGDSVLLTRLAGDHGLHLGVALNNLSEPVILLVASVGDLTLEALSSVDLADGVLHLTQELVSNLGLLLVDGSEPSLLNLVDNSVHVGGAESGSRVQRHRRCF